jgi:DNA polymerase III alpha subunit (gram-positive type)
MESKYIAFDCETTGVDDRSNLLTVSFLILDRNLKEVDSLNLSLKQNNGYHIYPEAMEINRIDIIKHHHTSLELIDARKKLIDFLIKNKGKFNLIPIGHNIQFDIKAIKTSGLLTSEEYSKYISYNTLDTISIAQFLKLTGHLHEKQSLSLVNLCSSSQLKRDERLEHSSEYDIKMTIKLLKFFKKTIGNESEENVNKKRKVSLI